MARTAHADDFALSRVTPEARKPWFGIAVQRFGQVSALSQFLLGATLGYSMTFGEAVLAFLFGSLILEVIMCVVGFIGQREGLNTALLARWTGFGEIGASLVGLAIGISLIGWFGIQSAISAQSLDALMPGALPVWAWSLIFGLAVTAIVAFGFVGMQWLANITVPLFLILVGWSVISELTRHDIGELLTGPAPGPTMSVWAGTGIVAGGLIVGAIITGDMTRFNRSRADVVKQTVVGVSLGEFVIGLAGVLLAHAAASGDIVAIVTSSVGFIGLFIVLTGTLKINDWNLYSSTLGLVNFISTAFGKNLHRVTTTIVLGIVGSVLAAVGILGQFTEFLIVLSVAFPPIAGIMVAEYYIVRRWRPELDATREAGTLPATAPRIVPATIVVWLVSALVGYFVTWGIPSLLSLFLSMVLYIVAGKLGWVRGVGVATTRQAAPIEEAAAAAGPAPRQTSPHRKARIMHIGIDVGGTNTDAVLMDGTRTLAGVKHSTTPDVTSGIIQAIEDLRVGHAFAGADIDAVMIGTTHFINALVQASRLAPVAALRLGLPATRALPPLVDWPEVLVEATQARSYLAHGGYEFDGRPISPLDPEEIRAHAEDMKAHGIRSVAISSVFSPVNHDLEVQAAEIVASVLGDDAAISLSHEIGRIGLLERENATIINAALRELASEIVDGLTSAVRAQGIEAPIFLSQNDGTLMDEEYVRRYPVATFASGPTNSMRGAAATSGLDDCAVIDVGGTTADIGLLINGFPRETANEVKVAGIRTNFRMPDVLSLGIGGGSIVDEETAEVGPASVGYRLTTEALVFGGSTLTATDIAVAAGRAQVGDASRVAHLDPVFVQRVLARIAERVSEAVDRMRTSPEPIAVVAVGGGSILLPDELPLFGTVHRPENYAVANAIGASIAQVGGEIDKVYAIEPGRRDETIAEVRAEAVDKAIAAGAKPSTVSIIDFDEVPIPYLPGNATRIRVKAVGDLDMGAGHELDHHVCAHRRTRPRCCRPRHGWGRRPLHRSTPRPSGAGRRGGHGRGPRRGAGRRSRAVRRDDGRTDRHGGEAAESRRGRRAGQGAQHPSRPSDHPHRVRRGRRSQLDHPDRGRRSTRSAARRRRRDGTCLPRAADGAPDPLRGDRLPSRVQRREGQHRRTADGRQLLDGAHRPRGLRGDGLLGHDLRVLDVGFRRTGVAGGGLALPMHRDRRAHHGGAGREDGPGRWRRRSARRAGAVRRQGGRRAPGHHDRLRPGARAHRRRRRGDADLAVPERASGGGSRRRRPRDHARPDHGARRRVGGADHDRGAALRTAGAGDRGSGRRALAFAGGARDGRPRVLRVRHGCAPLRWQRLRRNRCGGSRRMSWQLTAADLPDLARGATLLGTGGGGDPYIGKMLVERVLGEGSITILDPDELPDDLFVIPTAQMGAPTVMIEKIPAGTEPTLALRTLEEHLGRKADATMPIECGGINSMIPLIVAAETGLPVVDADGMGRAFPELSMETFAVYGVHGSPLALAGERGEKVVIDTGDDDRQMEWLARGITIRLGGVGHIAEYAMTGADVRRTAVPRTISMALALGRAIRLAREEHRSPFEAIARTLSTTLYPHLRELCVGKVVDVERRTTEGFAKGRAVIAPLGADEGDTFEISFQNENLIAHRGDTLVAIVPDLICVVDHETAEPITTEGLRYGQRVRVLGISTPEMMRTSDALAAFGPSAFGLAAEFAPIEALAAGEGVSP